MGSVAWQYNNDFKKILETASGASGTAQTLFGYDDDQLLTCASPTTCNHQAADALRLTRSPQNGLVTGIALGNTTRDVHVQHLGRACAADGAYSQHAAHRHHLRRRRRRPRQARAHRPEDGDRRRRHQGLPVHVRPPATADGRHHQRRARRALRLRPPTATARRGTRRGAAPRRGRTTTRTGC